MTILTVTQDNQRSEYREVKFTVTEITWKCRLGIESAGKQTSLYLTFFFRLIFFNCPTMLVDFAHILSTFWFNYLALLIEILLLR
jgi:hypothetical protein